MAERPISDLRERHEGDDIWVIASGASAGFIEPSFFDNKIAISVNEAWLRFPNADYIVRKEAKRSGLAYASGIPLIISRHNCGSVEYGRNKIDGDRDYYVFEHQDNGLKFVELSAIDRSSDLIVVSFSTITSAVHIAAYMGASNIILVGHDCGLIDGRTNFDGYPGALAGPDFYRKFLTEIEPQTIAVRERIKQVYGCNVYSLNPWLNFGMEGHKYERSV